MLKWLGECTFGTWEWKGWTKSPSWAWHCGQNSTRVFKHSLFRFSLFVDAWQLGVTLQSNCSKVRIGLGCSHPRGILWPIPVHWSYYNPYDIKFPVTSSLFCQSVLPVAAGSSCLPPGLAAARFPPSSYRGKWRADPFLENKKKATVRMNETKTKPLFTPKARRLQGKVGQTLGTGDKVSISNWFPFVQTVHSPDLLKIYV